MRLTIDLMQAENGEVWLYVDGHRHGPYKTLEQATDEAACELRHHYRISVDPEYAAAVGATPTPESDERPDTAKLRRLAAIDDNRLLPNSADTTRAAADWIDAQPLRGAGSKVAPS